jgi:DNA-directed RNA polymerase subunit RPC12/RpoP
MARRSATITDYRSVLEGKGEVAIGARARAERRKRMMIALAGLGLIAAAAGAHFLLRPRDTVDVGRMTPLLVQCVDPNCAFLGVVNVRLGEARFPLRCPKCGQQTCQKVWECRECGHRFVPVAAGGELQCPECGKRRVGTATLPGPDARRE